MKIKWLPQVFVLVLATAIVVATGGVTPAQQGYPPPQGYPSPPGYPPPQSYPSPPGYPPPSPYGAYGGYPGSGSSARPYGTTPYEHHGVLPSGPYIESCRNVAVDRHQLEAECERRDGNWRWTHLDLDDCSRGIVNDNGRLECPSIAPPRLPAGSYQETCRGLAVEDRHLTGQCRRRNGEWRDTHLDLTRCHVPVSNDDGRLTCGEG